MLWLILNVGPLWITLYCNKHMKADPSEQEKYKPFERLDCDKWSYVLGLVTHFFYWPRMCVGWFVFWIGIFYVKVVCFGHKTGEPFKDWQYSGMRWTTICIARSVAAISLNIPVMRRVECDYSEWLGPDYEYTYEGAGFNVCNHVSVIDVIYHTGWFKPFNSFVGKLEATKVPGIGPVCEIL